MGAQTLGLGLLPTQLWEKLVIFSIARWHGGTSRNPEIYEAEHLLTKRSIDPATGEKLVNLVRWWEIIPVEIKEQWINNPVWK